MKKVNSLMLIKIVIGATFVIIFIILWSRLHALLLHPTLATSILSWSNAEYNSNIKNTNCPKIYAILVNSAQNNLIDNLPACYSSNNFQISISCYSTSGDVQAIATQNNINLYVNSSVNAFQLYPLIIHELVHLHMFNSLKIIQLSITPHWFQEGMAEYYRYKISGKLYEHYFLVKYNQNYPATLEEIENQFNINNFPPQDVYNGAFLFITTLIMQYGEENILCTPFNSDDHLSFTNAFYDQTYITPALLYKQIINTE